MRTRPRRYGPLARTSARAAAILLLAAAFAFPLYWTVTIAFKPQPEWNPPGQVVWWPRKPTLDNFTGILGLRAAPESPFLQQPTRSALRPLQNSLIAAGAGTALAMLLGVLTAYGISRFRAGGRLFPFTILQLRMFPPIVLASRVSSLSEHSRSARLAARRLGARERCGCFGPWPQTSPSGGLPRVVQMLGRLSSQ